MFYLRCNAAKEKGEARIFKHWFIRMHFASSYIFTQSLQSLQRNAFATLLYLAPSAWINTLHWSILPNNIFRIEIFSVHLHCVTWSLRKASHICAFLCNWAAWTLENLKMLWLERLAMVLQRMSRQGIANHLGWLGSEWNLTRVQTLLSKPS